MTNNRFNIQIILALSIVTLLIGWLWWRTSSMPSDGLHWTELDRQTLTNGEFCKSKPLDIMKYTQPKPVSPPDSTPTHQQP